MRKTEENERMLERYKPRDVGRRTLRLMKAGGMTLKTFSHLLQSCSVPPFGNLPKYVSAADLAGTPERAEKDGALCEALGRLILDYAVTAYQAAIVLKTDPLYLAKGEPYRKDPAYPTTWPDGSEEEKLARVRTMAAAVDYRRISQRIREARAMRGMNVRQLAAAARVSTSTIAGYENAGITKPQRFSCPVFLAICEALDVYPDWLMLGCSMYAMYDPFSDDPEIVYGYNGHFGYPAPALRKDTLAESDGAGNPWEEKKAEEGPERDLRWLSDKLGRLSAREIAMIRSAVEKWHPEWEDGRPGQEGEG